VEIEHLLSGDHPADRFPDDRLVVDEEDHAAAWDNRGEGIGAAEWGLRDVHGDDSLSTGGGQRAAPVRPEGAYQK
jgi:hypothetical protein